MISQKYKTEQAAELYHRWKAIAEEADTHAPRRCPHCPEKIRGRVLACEKCVKILEVAIEPMPATKATPDPKGRYEGWPGWKIAIRAAQQLSVEKRGGSFLESELVVRCWQLHPEMFGLAHCPDLYPDARKVVSLLCGNRRGLATRGSPFQIIERMAAGVLMYHGGKIEELLPLADQD